MTGQSRLLQQLSELLVRLDRQHIRHALIGGIAVNIHGYSRATHDIDLLIDVVDEPALHALMTELGYETIDRREDLSSYVRGHERADFLHARRPISRGLLSAAHSTAYAGLAMPVVSLEGLLGLKVQAFADDPRRLQDVVDMLEIVRGKGSSLRWDEVRGYFALFGREALFDELKRAAGEDRD